MDRVSVWQYLAEHGSQTVVESSRNFSLILLVLLLFLRRLPQLGAAGQLTTLERSISRCFHQLRENSLHNHAAQLHAGRVNSQLNNIPRNPTKYVSKLRGHLIVYVAIGRYRTYL